MDGVSYGLWLHGGARLRPAPLLCGCSDAMVIGLRCHSSQGKESSSFFSSLLLSHRTRHLILLYTPFRLVLCKRSLHHHHCLSLLVSCLLNKASAWTRLTAMAPIAVKAPTGVKPTTALYGDKSMKRGRSIKRSSTQRRPQQLSPHFAQAMQGQQDEDEAATISDHPSLQPYRRRERQSYINPRQQMLHLPDSARPATSRSHTMRDWNHHRDRSRSPSFSKKLPPSDSLSQQPHVESHFSLGTASMGMTSEEFEALPPTIQRKVSCVPHPQHSCRIFFFPCSLYLTCSKVVALLQVFTFSILLSLGPLLFSPCIQHRDVFTHLVSRGARDISKGLGLLVRVASRSTRLKEK